MDAPPHSAELQLRPPVYAPAESSRRGVPPAPLHAAGDKRKAAEGFGEESFKKRTERARTPFHPSGAPALHASRYEDGSTSPLPGFVTTSFPVHCPTSPAPPSPSSAPALAAPALHWRELLKGVRVASSADAKGADVSLDARVTAEGKPYADSAPVAGKPSFAKCAAWLKHHAAEVQAKVLGGAPLVVVYCDLGRSRSPAVVLAWLRLHCGLCAAELGEAERALQRYPFDAAPVQMHPMKTFGPVLEHGLGPV